MYTRDTNQENLTSTISTAPVGYMQQLLKGVAALSGLALLGGAAYWLTGWLRGKTNEDGSKVGDKSVLSQNSRLRDLSSPIPVSQYERLSSGITSKDDNVVEGKNSASNAAISNDHINTKSSDYDHVFSTDDLEYRHKDYSLEIQPPQRKLLSSFQAVESHYLAAVDLRVISNGWGFKINGEVTGDRSGKSVSAAGDINGDGIADLVIGADLASPSGRSYAGSSYVLFGKKGNWAGSFELSSINGTNGFKLNGEAAGDESGWSVSAAGDINGDGIADLVIGSLGAAPYGYSGAGTTYVVFGKNGSWGSSLELSNLNGTNGFKLNGEAADDQSGYSVSAAGDINGDGMADLVIGAPSADPSGRSYAGSSYIVFGTNTTLPGSFNLTNLNGANGFKINGKAGGDSSGNSVCGVGDINGDDIDDVVIGAYLASPPGRAQAGSSYMVFGKKGNLTSLLELSSINGVNGFKINGEAANDRSGHSVSGAGDVNGDGIADVVIGAYGADPAGRPYAGSSYIVFGKKGNWTSALEFSSLNGMNGFKINGETGNDYSGYSVSGAGDINGDGIADVIIGASQASPWGRTRAGSSYVVFGKNTTWTSPLELSSLNGVNGFKINGEAAGDQSGNSVGAAGDINDDGIADLVIGASQASPSGRTGAGASYVIFGGDKFTFVNNTISVYQGRALNITNANLGITSTFGNFASRTYTFAINNIQHGYFSCNGTVAATFTNKNIAASLVQFVHDDSQFAPSYQVAVDDGLVGTDPVYAAINFVSKPFLVNNHLSINQGQSIVITDMTLSADVKSTGITNSDPEKLLFSITDLRQGRFADLADQNFNITSFVQAKITNSSIVFIHDNSQNAPSYKVSVSDGITSTLASAAVISFNIVPILEKRNFYIGQGQTITVTDQMLSASDVDSDPNTLQFFISNLQHANFILAANQTTTPTTTFLQNRIGDGVIQLQHDGTLNAPRFNVSVSDSFVNTSSVEALIQFDLAPVLVNNKITIGQGATLVLTQEMLKASDIDSNTDSLTFIVGETAHGKFASVYNPGLELTQFTQSQVINKLIRFGHDNSFLPPSYQIRVSDGTVATSLQNATVTFDFAPVLGNNQLIIGQGQEAFITSIMLNASDADTNSSSLVFKTSDIQHGQFVLVADTSVIKTDFTQGDVTAGKIKFIHDNTNVAPGYLISVDDGIVALNPVSAAVTFYHAPTLLAHRLIVNQGETVILSTAMLNAVGNLPDPETLIFKLGKVLNGKFTFLSQPATPIFSFNLQQVIAGAVQFTHDNSQIAPSCSVSLDDGFVTLSSSAMIVIFDAAPVLSNNQLNINQGESVIISDSMLSAVDKDSNLEQLTFQVSEPSYGSFWFKSSSQSAVVTTSFTQEQIASGSIFFLHDNSEFSPSYKIAVSDGIISTKPETAVITFTPAPVNNDAVIGSATGAGVSGLIGLGIWLFKKYIDSKLKNEFSGKSLQNQICKAILERMKLSGCLGYMNFELTQEFRFAVNTLLQAIAAVGVEVAADKLNLSEKKELANTIALQIETTLLPPRTCCNKFGRFFKDYCVAELTPKQIEANADAIAVAVKTAQNSSSLEKNTTAMSTSMSASSSAVTNSASSTATTTTASRVQSGSIEMTNISHSASSTQAQIDVDIQTLQEKLDGAVNKVTAVIDNLKNRQKPSSQPKAIEAKAEAVGSSKIDLSLASGLG